MTAQPSGSPAGHNPVTVGSHLDVVAVLLVGVLVIVAGVMGILGLTSDRVATALNNNAAPLFWAGALAAFAILCSVIALMCRQTRGGNHREWVALFIGGLAFIFALILVVCGTATSANGSGQPTITSVKTEGGHANLTLSFTVHADGVRKSDRISVVVQSAAQPAGSLQEPARTGFYVGSLRSDDRGRVNQQVQIRVSPGSDAELSIIASKGADHCDGQCKLDAPQSTACVTVRLPVAGDP